MHGLRMNRVATLLALGGALHACGNTDKKDKEPTVTSTTAVAGKGSVATASSGLASIDFSAAAVGSQFVLMPVILGDVATVTGAGDQKFTLTLSVAAAAASSKLLDSEPEVQASGATATGLIPAMNWRQKDDALRTLLNRFEPRLGAAQGDDFWRLAKRVDAVDAASFAATDGPGEVESMYRSAVRSEAMRPRSGSARFNLTSSNCPSASGTVAVPNASLVPIEKSIPSAATSVVSTADYCIVYLSDPVTGGDKATIEASIKEVIRRYKEVIYNDPFAAVNGYTFKPIFTIVDFSDTKLWPNLAALQVSGAFIAKMSDDTADTVGTNMPMIYMASDISKVGKNVGAAVDAAKNKRLWHGTIAHEMQHAIMNYFRARKVSADPKKWTLETAEVDEGIAHYVEDLFGHGGENFDDFAKTFLTTWYDKDLVNPVLSAAEDLALNRGAAQTLIYYLISQKGGVTFTNGVASGGDGLKYLAEVVKGATHVGPQNLAEKFGGAWTDAISNYFGALAIDGSGISDTDPKYTVQDPQKATNLIGETDHSYGMHYNNFSDLPKAHTWTEVAKDAVTTPELQYYATCPYLYTVTDSTLKVGFKTKDTLPNTAVAVVQIK